jgi:nucleotidyltransferase AbiEii toxin of type IV toxin-antitoxin system
MAELVTTADLIERRMGETGLTIDGKDGFYLDPADARWTTGNDIYEAKGMPFSIERVAFGGHGRGRMLDISMTVRRAECIDGPRLLRYTDTMLAGEPSFLVQGLTLEELAAEKVLGWASKELSKHFIDLAYLGRDHAHGMDLDHVGRLVGQKFAQERQHGRYRSIRGPGDLADAFADKGRIDQIRAGWNDALGRDILFLPKEQDRANDSLTAFDTVARYATEVWVPVLRELA